MATVQVSCTTSAGKKTRTVSIGKFAGLDNPGEEARLYLRLWCIARKLEAANETDPNKLKLRANERAAITRCTPEYFNEAGTASTSGVCCNAAQLYW